MRTRATVVQQKTHRPVQFELMTEARKTLLTWLTRRGGTLDDFIFPSRTNYMGHISTRQYARLVDEWVGAAKLNLAEYGTHSMRRTKASLIYKATGNLRAVQIVLGHTNIENTVRYLVVDIDDAITLAERTEIGPFAFCLLNDRLVVTTAFGRSNGVSGGESRLDYSVARRCLAQLRILQFGDHRDERLF